MFQVQLLASSSATWALSGAVLLLIGSIAPTVAEEYELNPTQKGLVVGLAFLGVFSGNVTGTLADTFGRRLPIIGSPLVVLCVSIPVVLWDPCRSLKVLALLFFALGFGCGLGQPACNALLVELAPTEHRVTMIAFSQVIFAMGEVLAAFVLMHAIDGGEVKTLEEARTVMILVIVPLALIGLIYSFAFTPESPRYLLARGRREEAEKVVAQLTALNDSCRTCGPSMESESVPFVRLVSLEDAETGQEPAVAERGVFQRLATVLCKRSVFVTTWVMALTAFTLNFLFYGGLYAFLQILGGESMKSLTFSLFCRFPGYAIVLAVGSLCGRRRGMQFYLAGVILAAGCFLAGHGNNALLVRDFAMGFYQFSVAAGVLLVYVYALEVYPTDVRATGAAVNLASGRIGSTLCAFVFEVLAAREDDEGNREHDPKPFFQVVIALAAVNAALIFLLAHETCGVSLEEMEKRMSEAAGENEPLLASEQGSVGPK